MKINIDMQRLNVVDVESTCWKGKPAKGASSDIIEIGIVQIGITGSGPWEFIQREDILIVPEHSTISEFCTELTHITPDMVEGAPRYPDAIKYLRETYETDKFPWASWGHYDRKMFLNMQDKYSGKPWPWPKGPNYHFNAKTFASLMLGMKGRPNVAAALRSLGMDFEGSPHRAGDDAYNISRILMDLLNRGRK